MSDDYFSMKPTTQAEMDDLAANGIDWIKAKLAKAELHVRNVQEIRQLATEQELSEEDYYCLLAYRATTELIDMVQAATRGMAAAQSTAMDAESNSGLILSPEGDVLSSANDDAPQIIL